MSAIGPKQTWASALHMSTFRGKADMTSRGANGRADDFVYHIVARSPAEVNGMDMHSLEISTRVPLD
jgi:hypothetical protein